MIRQTSPAGCRLLLTPALSVHVHTCCRAYGIKPVAFKTEGEEGKKRKVELCGCKYTNTPPYCDGTVRAVFLLCCCVVVTLVCRPPQACCPAASQALSQTYRQGPAVACAPTLFALQCHALPPSLLCMRSHPLCYAMHALVLSLPAGASADDLGHHVHTLATPDHDVFGAARGTESQSRCRRNRLKQRVAR